MLIKDAPRPPDLTALAGYAANSHVEKISWEQLFKLAILRAKAGPNAPLMESFDPAKLDAQAKQLGLDDLATLRAAFLESPSILDPIQRACELLTTLQDFHDQFEGITSCQQLLEVYEELARGENSGITERQLLQLRVSFFSAVDAWPTTLQNYRVRLDRLKVALGLSPRATIVIDDAPLALFRDTYQRSLAWLRTPARQLNQVPNLIKSLPPLRDVSIENRPFLERLKSDHDFDRFEDWLQAAASVAEARKKADGNAVANELELRRRLHSLIATARDFGNARDRYLLATYQVDTEFERMIAPPAAGREPVRASNLLPIQQARAKTQTRLVQLWMDYHANRLRVLQSLGAFPFASTKAFYGSLTPEPTPAPR